MISNRRTLAPPMPSVPRRRLLALHAHDNRGYVLAAVLEFLGRMFPPGRTDR
jgi:hypothetical protein